MNPIDNAELARLRADTPGAAQVIHFNNAGAALMPQPVLDTVQAHLSLEASIGGYEAADREVGGLQRVYTWIAQLLHAAPSEIAVLENASRAWAMAFYGLAFKAGDRLLTAQAEYVSNYLAYLQVAQRTGARVEIIPNDESGQVSVEALERMLDERVKLISITHVPTSGGLVNPAAAIGRVARSAGVPYLLDACQSVGQMAVDVQSIGCDMLSATGRKYLRGPRGTGFLYVRRSFLEQIDPPFAELQSAEWLSATEFAWRPGAVRFESWESNVAAKLGLGRAVEYALRIGIDRIEQRVTRLAASLRERLQMLPGVEICDQGAQQCGIVTFRSDRVDAATIHRALAQRHINISISLREYTLLDLAQRRIDSLVRASVHYYNTAEEIDLFATEVGRLVRRQPG